MKTIICITLIFQLFVSISASANTCTPTVSKGNVLVEVINGDGKTVYSEQHQVRNEKKYSGLISSSKIYKLLKYDKSGKIKVDKSKFKLAAGGTTTKATKKDGSAIAKIGGCPISEVTLFTRLGKQKDPFVHNDLIQIASKSTGLKIAGNDKPINKTKNMPAESKSKNQTKNIPVKSKSITNNSVSKPASKPVSKPVSKDALFVFGVPLGEHFDKNSVSKVLGRRGTKTQKISVQPKKPHPYIKDYTLLARQGTNEWIYEITVKAGKDYCNLRKNKPDCIKKTKEIYNSLVKRYGEPDKKSGSIDMDVGHFSAVFIFGKMELERSGPRYKVELNVSASPRTVSPSLRIKYHDKETLHKSHKMSKQYQLNKSPDLSKTSGSGF